MKIYLGELPKKKQMFLDTMGEALVDPFHCGERVHTLIDSQTGLPPNWIRFGWKEEPKPIEIILDPQH